MNKETLVSFRYCFQTILVPCVVFIGVLGNSVSVLVLTRKRMRSSTNIYLTALAVSDIIYLMMVLSLSFQHYKNIHHPKYELYWRTYGLQYWFCDAASYTSIYITVSFTIERYIAVCHPIRGQVLCTESKAKKVISVVVIMCLLCTCTTPFEHLLNYTPQYVDAKTYESCTPSALNDSAGMQIPVPNCTLPWTTPSKVATPSSNPLNSTVLAENGPPILSETIANITNVSLSSESAPTLIPASSVLTTNNPSGMAVNDLPSSTAPTQSTSKDNYYHEEYSNYDDYKDYLGDSPIILDDKVTAAQAVAEDTEMALIGDDENMANMIMPFPTVGQIELNASTMPNNTTITPEVSPSLSSSAPSLVSSPSSSVTSVQDNCRCIYYLEAKSSPLGENETYITVFMWTTSVVFTFIPLILLITFNTFLVMAVRASNKTRDKLTNVNSRKVKTKVALISQENKITITLIAVVILFIICQTPTAIYIIVKTSLPQDLPEEIRNIHFAIGNVFNFLITINAASNFFLYCALSEKYRQTVKELIMGRNHLRQATLKSFYLNRHGTISESLYSSQLSSRRSKQPTPPQLPSPPPDQQSKQSTPIPPRHSHPSPTVRGSSVSRNSSQRSERSLARHMQGRNSFHHEPIPEHRASDPVPMGLCRKHSGTPSMHANIEGVPGIHKHLKSSGSSSSLTRSQSVIIEPKVRHSPHCKKYNNL